MQATSHFVNVGAVNFHYVDWGGSGTPIVLLHGLASTVHIWDLVAPALTAHGHVIALDQRGHGLTSQPPTGYDFGSIAADLANFVQAIDLREKFLLVGHSWGAHVALYFAHTYADLVRGVALVDGGVMDLKTQWPTWEIAEKAMTPPPLIGKTLPEIQTSIKEQWLGDAWTPATGAAALSVYKVADDGFVYRRLAGAQHMQIARAIWEFTPAPYFAQLTCPLLLAIAMPSDPNAPLDDWQADKQRQVLTVAQLAKACQVVWFHATMHDIPWHRPELLADTLRHFIAEIGHT
jgi:pimeloyl-ACP methyl ester carboxylesterase